ncbi:MAG TPA: hypothetical protein VGP59_10200, partial [Pyrinomonadaceae bacterium]|nr:hypothetical protein [Pyrinomonadaceae bacterium]
SVPVYTQEMGVITGQQFYALSLVRKLFGWELPPIAYMIATIFIMSALALWVLLRRTEDYLKHAMLLATATTVLFAPHFSWYFCWLVFFLCFTPRLAVFYLTIANLFLYRTWLGDSPDEMFMINSVIYLPALLIALIEWVAAPKARDMEARGKRERSERVAPGYETQKAPRPERPK